MEKRRSARPSTRTKRRTASDPIWSIGLRSPIRIHLALHLAHHDSEDGALALAGFELGRIGAPASVVAGRDDRIFPPHRTNALVDAGTGSRLAFVAGAGHNTSIECPDAFHAAIVACLAVR